MSWLAIIVLAVVAALVNGIAVMTALSVIWERPKARPIPRHFIVPFVADADTLPPKGTPIALVRKENRPIERFARRPSQDELRISA